MSGPNEDGFPGDLFESLHSCFHLISRLLSILWVELDLSSTESSSVAGSANAAVRPHCRGMQFKPNTRTGKRDLV